MAKRNKIKMGIRAFVKTESYNESENTIDVVFVTEAGILMKTENDQFIEILSCDPDHVHLERLNSGAPFLKVHDPEKLENQIGVVVKAWMENSTGVATIKLSGREDCAGIVNDIKEGIIKNISVGYTVNKYESLGENEDGIPILKAIDWEASELSSVPIPADYGATTRNKKNISKFKIRKMAQTREDKIKAAVKRANLDDTVADELIESGATVEEALEEILEILSDTPADPNADPGTDPNADPNRAAETEEERAAREEEEKAAEGGDGKRSKPKTSSTRMAVVAERKRAATILKAAKVMNVGDELAQQLIDNGTTMARAMEILVNKGAAEQKVTNARVGERDETVTATRAMEEALMHRAKPSNNPITIEKAHDFKAYTLLDFARQSLENKGVRTAGFSKMELVKRALSSSDFPSLLSNTVNKFLRKSYEEAPQTWKPLATQMSANDFKDITGIQFGGAITLEKVAEHGEFKQAELAESAERFKIDTYGKIVSITRQAIINDDLNGFARTSELFGNAAARLESDIMWGLITKNGKMSDGKALFHTDHNNLASSGAAISETSLDAARIALMRQTGLNKEVLNLIPLFLVVSPEKQMEAQKQMTAITANTTGSVNVFNNAYTIIVDARLTGNAWYLTTSPSQIDIMSYAYLSGNEGLYTETKEGFEMDGVQIKARLDFGGVVWDYRGLYKNPGA